ncbi:type I methionyl aminopeptidase [Marinilactibacillus kalidii]|uniref:type I methionyl aminopeptidase n=1 Tax=Marinilactibacillus kalidii TaxID=2820274 RepID=UPI001ABDB024|nr:type I methionyl aminopeptidase [Marinilactibacillus kalidii]
MIAKTEEDYTGLKEIGKICGTIRDELIAQTKPGVTTKELDELAGKMLEEAGAVSAPKGVYDFPGYTCISVNEEIAHGIPGDRVIHEGDLVNIDVSASKNGYFADTGRSFVVGEGPEISTKVCEMAKAAFEAGLKKAMPGFNTSDLGEAVYKTAKENNLTVIMTLTGHGIGRSIHESPNHIFNYKNRRDDVQLREGMVIAFEPFISSYEEEFYQKDDDWTLAVDQSKVAQIEHTIIVSKDGPIIVTL